MTDRSLMHTFVPRSSSVRAVLLTADNAAQIADTLGGSNSQAHPWGPHITVPLTATSSAEGARLYVFYGHWLIEEPSGMRTTCPGGAFEKLWTAPPHPRTSTQPAAPGGQPRQEHP